VTLILTYHAVEDGPPPLCLAPALFAEHVRVIATSGARVMTVSEVVLALRAGELPPRSVAITFDDGYASVAEHAAPVLREHGLRATVFCVAGHLGGTNDWATQALWAPTLAVASGEAIDGLAAEGWEIGSHGVAHFPLDTADPATAYREVVESRLALEEATSATVPSFAWPYGARPSEAAASLIAETYEAACASGPAAVRQGADQYALPRIDSHYLRSAKRLRLALEREPAGYLAFRRVVGRTRRRLRQDFKRPGPP
jgi:peptidoglycan/xylan/chitin deacetylase (PgdA/CDA1 family)